MWGLNGGRRSSAIRRSLTPIFINAKPHTLLASRTKCPRHVLVKWLVTSTPLNERRARSKAAISLDYDQSPAEVLPELALGKSIPEYPTVIRQARQNMLKFENCVLLTRVGGFYELYFEHAEIYGPQLNLKVAQKSIQPHPVSMAGFPFFQLDRFLKILVQDLNQYVAIAEEFPNDAENRVKSGGLLFNRRVARVITPGTLIDENFMDPYTNNYVLSLHMNEDAALRDVSDGHVTSDHQGPEAYKQVQTSVGLAWLDLSTGQFSTQSSTLAMLSAVISRVGPREIILHDRLRNLPENHPLITILAEDKHLITHSLYDNSRNAGDWSLNEDGQRASDAEQFTLEEIQAGNLLLHYVEDRLQSTSVQLQPPKKYTAQETMVIDKSTMRALEIKSTMREGNHKGTLLHAIRRTVTKSGARLLDEWLTAPSTNISTINSRLDLVTFMLDNHVIAERVVNLLKRCHDSKRLVQRFSFNRGDANDLIALANTILSTNHLKTILSAEDVQEPCVTSILSRIELDRPLTLAERIKSAVDEEGLVQQHEIDEVEAGNMANLASQVAMTEGSAADLAGVSRKAHKKRPTSIKEFYANDGNVWIMKPSASPTLLDLHEELHEMGTKESILTQELGQRLNVSTLSLRWTPGLGHICHVKLKPKEKMNTAEVRSVSSSKSTQSFHHPEWTALGKEIDQLKLRIRAEEQQVFLGLREEVIINLVKLRQNATVLDELDIACSFANIAKEQSLVRPILNEGTAHKIVGGRHPTVQGSLASAGRTFVTNDCFVGDKQSLWLITGPNMAGKSTFLRQNALITLLAQTGSYVPAAYAEIGIVDQIFSRVGSADNLFRNQSTFMVEMLETATILKHATKKSFVIMDEIGRGTTPEDGTAVAFACLHHLYHINRCRTLFATHFHSLPKLCENKGMHDIGYYCTDIDEDESGGFSYVHKLRTGVNKQSHALKVAKIAGVPEAAIDVAREVINSLNR